MGKHIVRRGETLGSIAHRYTGDASRTAELLKANPRLAETQGSVGSFKDAFREGLRMTLPAGWGGAVGQEADMPVDYEFDADAWQAEQDAANALAAAQEKYPACTPYGTEVTDVKDYYYVVQAEDVGNFWKIPTKFNLSGDKENWQALRNANMDRKTVTVNTACVPVVRPGDYLRVPNNWPEPRTGVATVPIKTVADTKCTGGLVYEAGTGKCVEPRSCPSGTYLDEATNTCKEGVSPVGYTEGSSASTWLWVILGVGGAVGLGLLATGALKTKKSAG